MILEPGILRTVGVLNIMSAATLHMLSIAPALPEADTAPRVARALRLLELALLLLALALVDRDALLCSALGIGDSLERLALQPLTLGRLLRLLSVLVGGHASGRLGTPREQLQRLASIRG